MTVNVLIAENDPLIRKPLTRWLKNIPSLNVTYVWTVKGLLNALAVEPYDIVVLDNTLDDGKTIEEIDVIMAAAGAATILSFSSDVFPPEQERKLKKLGIEIRDKEVRALADRIKELAQEC